MVYRAVLVLLLISTSSCATSPRPAMTSRVGMMDTYARSVSDAHNDVAGYVRENLKEQKTFGYVKPYIPVMTAPVVRKVWVADHRSEQDGGVLVAGHWVYLMVKGPRWFIEDETKKVEVPVIIPTASASEESI